MSLNMSGPEISVAEAAETVDLVVHGAPQDVADAPADAKSTEGDAATAATLMTDGDNATSPPLALDHHHGHSIPAKIGTLPLAVMVFYSVSGGPIGIEPAVRAGGFLPSLLGFALAPLAWSVPEALVTAELGSAFPEASGGVAWVEEAFGSRAGFVAGYFTWFAGATDNAIYPVLFLDYLLQIVGTDADDSGGEGGKDSSGLMDPLTRFILLSSTSVVLAVINYMGLEIVGNMSMVICLISLSPFLILSLAGIPKVDPQRWLQATGGEEIEMDDDGLGNEGWLPLPNIGGVLWRPFLNNLFWNLNSFDSAANFAGEVENPGTVFPRAMFLSLFLVVISYFVPLLIAIGASDSSRKDWEDGYLAKVCTDVIGPWLGDWTVFAAGISNIALFLSEMSSDGMLFRSGFCPNAKLLFFHVFSSTSVIHSDSKLGFFAHHPRSCFVPPLGTFGESITPSEEKFGVLRNCGYEPRSPHVKDRMALHYPLRATRVDDDTAPVIAEDTSVSHGDLVDDEDDETGDEEDLTLTALLHEEDGVDANGEAVGGSKAAGIESESDELSHLQKGKPEGFYVIRQYPVPGEGFDLSSIDDYAFDANDVVRLGLTGDNVTLPVALMLLDPESFPSLSKARKACRKGNVLVHRGALGVDEVTGEAVLFDPDRSERGLVGLRVYPGDVVAKQVRMGGGFYPGSNNYAKPPFELPVIYEDDHFAIVNKPAGVVVYSHRKGGHGRMTVRSACPFALRPPRPGTEWILRRPQPVHRLDKPTSGLLLVAKTKPAMVDLTRQFVERKVKKTYTAIVNGIPFEDAATSISSEEAKGLGVDVSPEEEGEGARWQIIDHALEGKSALTVWRSLRYAKSLKARDGTLTLVELKPKTGRFHQLRRHMAWVCDRPLVGDSTYAEGSREARTWDRGLFLCSNEVALEHPFYNTDAGRREWDSIESEEEQYCGNMLSLSDDGKVMIRASIDLPKKFCSLLDWEEERSEKFAMTSNTTFST